MTWTTNNPNGRNRNPATPTPTWTLPNAGNAGKSGGASEPDETEPEAGASADDLPVVQHQDLPGLFELHVGLRSNLIIFGPSGAGKTRHSKDWLDAQGIRYFYRNFSALERPDLVGLPQIVNGHTDYAPPAFLPGPNDPETVLILDELDKCPRELELPLLELFDEHRSINGHPVNVKAIIATANLIDEGAGSRLMNHALLGRAALVRLQPSVKNWLSWAALHGIHPAVVGFIRGNPDYLLRPSDDPALYARPTPRRWEFVSRALHAMDPSALTRRVVVASYVGHQAAMHYEIWHDYYSELGPWLDRLLEDGHAPQLSSDCDRRLLFATCVCARLAALAADGDGALAADRDGDDDGTRGAGAQIAHGLRWLDTLSTDELYGAIFPYFHAFGRYVLTPEFAPLHARIREMVS